MGAISRKKPTTSTSEIQGQPGPAEQWRNREQSRMGQCAKLSDSLSPTSRMLHRQPPPKSSTSDLMHMTEHGRSQREERNWRPNGGISNVRNIKFAVHVTGQILNHNPTYKSQPTAVPRPHQSKTGLFSPPSPYEEAAQYTKRYERGRGLVPYVPSSMTWTSRQSSCQTGFGVQGMHRRPLFLPSAVERYSPLFRGVLDASH